jgi:hypothetical protein
MVNLEYWNSVQWVSAGGPFGSEMLAWASLGGDNFNYRAVDTETGRELTSRRPNNDE